MWYRSGRRHGVCPKSDESVLRCLSKSGSVNGMICFSHIPVRMESVAGRDSHSTGWDETPHTTNSSKTPWGNQILVEAKVSAATVVIFGRHESGLYDASILEDAEQGVVAAWESRCSGPIPHRWSGIVLKLMRSGWSAAPRDFASNSRDCVRHWGPLGGLNEGDIYNRSINHPGELPWEIV